MTSPALKTEGYLINTLHLDRCDTAFVCEYFNQCQDNESLKSTPIVLALENAGDLHGFDFHKIKAYAAELGFNIIGLCATLNPKIALFIKTWKLPVFVPGGISGNSQTASSGSTSAAPVHAAPAAHTVNNITNSNGIIVGSARTAAPAEQGIKINTAVVSDDEPDLHRPNDIIIENPFGTDEEAPSGSVFSAGIKGSLTDRISTASAPDIKTVEHKMSMGPAPSTVVVTPVKHAQQHQEIRQTAETAPVKEPVQEKAQNTQAEHQPQPVPQIVANPETTMIHVGNVRSGNSLYAKNKSLVIIGNVGDGAEIAADDCIYVFGSVRGRIQAGGRRNTTSIIYCNDFKPQLVSVAGIYSTIENMPPEVIGKGVLVSLKNGVLEYKIQ